MLKQSATVSRPTASEDSYGDNVLTYSTSSTIKCLIQPKGGRERAMAGSTGVEVTHTMYCLYAADVVESDRIVVGSTIYDVVFVADSAGMNHHKQIDLREVRPARAS